jgi:hypothetical protein
MVALFLPVLSGCSRLAIGRFIEPLTSVADLSLPLDAMLSVLNKSSSDSEDLSADADCSYTLN